MATNKGRGDVIACYEVHVNSIRIHTIHLRQPGIPGPPLALP